MTHPLDVQNLAEMVASAASADRVVLTQRSFVDSGRIMVARADVRAAVAEGKEASRG